MIIKYIFFIASVLYITGCAIGRSWDNPSIVNNEKTININKSVVIYSRDNSHLIRNALSDKKSLIYISHFIVKELKDSEEDKYPIIKINIEKPKYSKDFISYSYALSVLTFSILPGYTNETSNITLELKTEDNNGNIKTKSKKYNAKRHFFSWLPLLPFSNYGFIVNDEWGTSNTSSFWNEAYEYYIRLFLFNEFK